MEQVAMKLAEQGETAAEYVCRSFGVRNLTDVPPLTIGTVIQLMEWFASSQRERSEKLATYLRIERARTKRRERKGRIK